MELNTNLKDFHIILKKFDFRLLWLGETISLFGDQFYLIAEPWLVLRLTNDPFALGSVLALASIPRALFMLLGGALSDRFAPRQLMLISNLSRFIIVSLMAILVLVGNIQIWMLYVFSLAFGIADAFFYPAQTAMVPFLVEKNQYQSANALIQGTAQLINFIGPLFAGLLIVTISGVSSSDVPAGNLSIDPGMTTEMRGIGFAFCIDALTFLISLMTLWRMKRQKPVDSKADARNVLMSIWQGMVYVWRDQIIRMVFLLLAALNFLVIGPIIVGIPVLVNYQLAENAAAYGIIMSGFGGGALLGVLAAGFLPPPPAKKLGSTLLLVISLMGLGMICLGWAQSIWLAAALTMLMGGSSGYVDIMMITWFQKRSPAELLGRMMSLVIFASIGLDAVSQAVAGALFKQSIPWVFAGSGILMTLVSLFSLSMPFTRKMGLEVETE